MAISPFPGSNGIAARPLDQDLRDAMEAAFLWILPMASLHAPVSILRRYPAMGRIELSAVFAVDREILGGGPGPGIWQAIHDFGVRLPN